MAILSHLHQDHIGGLPELGGTRILVGAAQWATLDAPLPELNGLEGLAPMLFVGDLTYERSISSTTTRYRVSAAGATCWRRRGA